MCRPEDVLGRKRDTARAEDKAYCLLGLLASTCYLSAERVKVLSTDFNLKSKLHRMMNRSLPGQMIEVLSGDSSLRLLPYLQTPETCIKFNSI
jgi:hypothetical protein